MTRRIGIFGGSFDPVHLGHLWIAEAALTQLDLDQVIWIPASTSPLKRRGPVASDENRLQMLRLAISGHPDFVLDDREIRRGGISYTVDTIQEIQDQQPKHQGFLLIGSDSLQSFDRWHQPARLLNLIIPAVVQRGGQARLDFSVLQNLTTPDRIQLARDAVVSMPQIELSSTELRQRISDGKSIRYRVPSAVQAFIDSQTPYQSDRPSQPTG